jgi:nicotinate-nucleotide adenylyltransferase
VFGGTFDPPHIGHVAVARQLAETGDLDEVVWIPSRRPPHKPDDGVAPPSLRLEMVKAVTEGEEGQKWSDLELAREGPSYTVDTLRALRSEYPGVDLVLILGTDQFAELSTWREPEEVARLASLWILAREGQDPGDVDLGVEVEWTPARVSRVDVSSSDVRRRIREGEPFHHLIPACVAEVIERERLYRD